MIALLKTRIALVPEGVPADGERSVGEDLAGFPRHDSTA